MSWRELLHSLRKCPFGIPCYLLMDRQALATSMQQKANVWVSHLFTSKSGGSLGPWDTQSACEVGMTRNDQECVQMSSLNLLDPSVLTPLLWGLHQNCANRCGSRCLSGTCRNQRHTFQVRFVGCVRHIQLEGSRSCRIPFQAKHLAICKFLAENQHLRMHTHEQHQPLKSFVCNCMRFWLCTCSQKRFFIMFVSQPCPTAMCPDVHQHLHPPDHSPNSEAFLFLKETVKTQYRSAACHHVLFYRKRMKSQP